MLKIGITGNIGSGKTTICQIFEHLGVEVYYSDAKAKQFYTEISVKQEIKCLFGEHIFDSEQNIDTKKLAKIVFQSANELQKLNNVIHPLVINDFLKWCEQRENQNFILFESAILYSCSLDKLFDKIIFVAAPMELLLQRSTQRDNVDIETIKKRLETQQKNHNRHSAADFVIYNDEKQSLIREVIRIYGEIESISRCKAKIE